MLKPVVKTIEVPCNQEQAFNIFVNDFSNWWPVEHSVSAMRGETPKSISLNPKVEGKITEICHDGSKETWGRVLTLEPYSGFSMDFHPGKSSDFATLVELNFVVIDESTTKVVLTHSNWEAFGEDAEKMRNGFNNGWVNVFETAYANAAKP